MTQDKVSELAGRLARGRLERVNIDHLPDTLKPADQASAYAVQDAVHDILSDHGAGPIAGHKIGCTTPVMQAFLNIPNPCAGAVFQRTAHHQTGRFEHNTYDHVGVECEIAVRLGADLGPLGKDHDRGSVAPAVASVMAAIEVVDDRYVDYSAMGAFALIGDDFFNAGCVLGDPIEAWHALDLATLQGEMKINGAPVGTGVGADIMGHPYEALAWLANLMIGRGKYLRAGEFVLLGSLVETKWVAAGDRVDIAIESLGTASAIFD